MLLRMPSLCPSPICAVSVRIPVPCILVGFLGGFGSGRGLGYKSHGSGTRLAQHSLALEGQHHEKCCHKLQLGYISALAICLL